MPPILQRLTDMGLSEQRAHLHLTGGYVRVGRGDGVVVENPLVDVDLADPIRFQPGAVTERQ